jgi:hypothetical protein
MKQWVSSILLTKEERNDVENQVFDSWSVGIEPSGVRRPGDSCAGNRTRRIGEP